MKLKLNYFHLKKMNNLDLSNVASKAGEKLALNNSKEYQAHLNSQSIQGVILALSSGGKTRSVTCRICLCCFFICNRRKNQTRS